LRRVGEKSSFCGLFSKNGKGLVFGVSIRSACGKLCGNCVKLLDLHRIAAFLRDGRACAKPDLLWQKAGACCQDIFGGLFQSAKSVLVLLLAKCGRGYPSPTVIGYRTTVGEAFRLPRVVFDQVSSYQKKGRGILTMLLPFPVSRYMPVYTALPHIPRAAVFCSWFLFVRLGLCLIDLCANILKTC